MLKISKKLRLFAIIFPIFIFWGVFSFSGDNSVLAQGISLSGNCFATPSTGVVGQTVTWLVDVSGGEGLYSYRYLWSGSDNLQSANSSVSKVYRTPGVKTATVRVQSGGQQIFRNCSVVVEEPSVTGAPSGRDDRSGQGVVLGEAKSAQHPSVSCFANPDPAGVGENVVWQLKAEGFVGEKTYDWSGSDGLSGQTESVSISYRTGGIKSAQVLVSSVGQKTTANCSVEITDKESPVVLPVKNGTASVGGSIGAGAVPVAWRIVSLAILIIGGLILLSFVLILRRQRRAERAEMSLAYSNNVPGVLSKENSENNEKEMADFIQSEARERQVLISTDALDLLVEKAENDKIKAVRCLDCLVSEMKELPYPTTPGEERLPVIDKDEVEKCLQRNKNL